MNKSNRFATFRLLLTISVFVAMISCSAVINKVHVDINIIQQTTQIKSGGEFSFEDVKVGNSSGFATFTIQNTGTDALHLLGTPNFVEISGTDADSFSLVQNNLRSPIFPGSEQNFDISFMPTSEGLKEATISILYNDEKKSPYTFTINGTGTVFPEINVKQATDDLVSGTGVYEFPSVGINYSTPEIVFTIENIGTGSLNLTGSTLIEIAGTDASMFSANFSNTSTIIAPQDSTTFGITFTPTSAGLKTATVSISNNDSDENPYTFTIQGRNVTAEINVKYSIKDIPHNTGTFDFFRSRVAKESESFKFTIESLGVNNLQLTGTPLVMITGTDASEFAVNTSATLSTIIPGETTTFAIVFKPTSLGVKEATVNIENNDSDESPYTFTIKGVGTDDNALGWIGGGTDGWKTSTAPNPAKDLRSMNYATGFFVDPKGYIYVSDGGNHRVVKWDFAGNAIGWIGHNRDGWQTGDAPNNSGKNYKSFYGPSGIYVDTDGTIYVADIGNHRICKWSADGIAIGWIGGGSDGWKTSNAPSPAADFRSLMNPYDVLMDSSGNIYVADYANHRVCKWTKSGNAVGWLGGASNGWKTTTAPPPLQDYQSVSAPNSICFDSAGYLYVSESGNNRVSKWSLSANAQGCIGGGSNGWKTTTATSTFGTDYQSFYHPAGVFVDPSGNIYVGDTINNRVCKWSSNGTAIGWIGGGSNGWQTSSAPSLGTDYKSFSHPVNIRSVSNGILYIIDDYNHRISKWQE